MIIVIFIKYFNIIFNLDNAYICILMINNKNNVLIYKLLKKLNFFFI